MIFDMIYDIWLRIRPYIPCFYYSIALGKLSRSTTSILDAGCGEGRAMSAIRQAVPFNYAVGADLFRPYLMKCRRQNLHDDYVLCNIERLPFKEKCFDVVFCFEVLEHLEKNAGYSLIHKLEKIACVQVMMSTPVGFEEQEEWQNNPFERHVSAWFPEEFRLFGYFSRGTGLRGTSGENGLLPNRLAKRFKAIEVLRYLLWICATPLTYFFPFLAGNIISFKANELS
jgi:SAM-dependent methyltransferase